MVIGAIVFFFSVGIILRGWIHGKTRGADAAMFNNPFAIGEDVSQIRSTCTIYIITQSFVEHGYKNLQHPHISYTGQCSSDGIKFISSAFCPR